MDQIMRDIVARILSWAQAPLIRVEKSDSGSVERLKMSELFWLMDEHMERLRPFFPRSHSKGVGILSRPDAFAEIAQGLLAFVPIASSRISLLTLALCIDRARQLAATAQLIPQEIEKRALA